MQVALAELDPFEAVRLCFIDIVLRVGVVLDGRFAQVIGLDSHHSLAHKRVQALVCFFKANVWHEILVETTYRCFPESTKH